MRSDYRCGIHLAFKEIEYEEIRYEKPEVIIAKIEALENEIQKSLKDF